MLSDIFRVVTTTAILVLAASAFATEAKVRLEAFDASPFPYRGTIPEQDVPFLDVTRDGRSGHTSPRGGIYWEEPTYSDRNVLLADPVHATDHNRPVIVVYMHGNQAKLVRDVWHRQRVPQQVAASGLDAALVAPQLAVDALDSSAGRFWEPGFFDRFLDEAVRRLAGGDVHRREVLGAAPVILVAYSGGYLPAAFTLQWGDTRNRIKGVILLDGIYAEEPRFAEWIARRRDAFFFSAFSPSTQKPNETLEALLHARGLFATEAAHLPKRLGPGSIDFLRTPVAVTHNDFLTQAWTADPLRAVLSRVEAR